jgi:hypothetical protein
MKNLLIFKFFHVFIVSFAIFFTYALVCYNDEVEITPWNPQLRWDSTDIDGFDEDSYYDHDLDLED